MDLACFPGVGVKLNDSSSAQGRAALRRIDTKRQSRFGKDVSQFREQARAVLCGVGCCVGAGDTLKVWGQSCHIFDGSVAHEPSRSWRTVEVLRG